MHTTPIQIRCDQFKGFQRPVEWNLRTFKDAWKPCLKRLFFFVYSRDRHTAYIGRPIFTTYRSYDVFPRKEWRLWVAFILRPILGIKCPKTTIWGVEIGLLKPNMQNIQTFVLQRINDCLTIRSVELNIIQVCVCRTDWQTRCYTCSSITPRITIINSD